MASGVDPVVGVAQALSVLVGATVASAIAPHLVVFISGIAGGILSLMSWRETNFFQGAAYVIGMGLFAWLFAGSTAEMLSLWIKVDDMRLVSPAALAIGWIGHRWPRIGRWLGELAKDFVEFRFRQQTRTGGNDE